MSNIVGYLPLLFFFWIYISEGQPARFCATLSRDCTTECRENGTFPIFDCVVSCVCSDLSIEPFLSFEECESTLDQIRSECRGERCDVRRFFNRFCSTLGGSCCNPNELDLIDCDFDPVCCDGEWICPNSIGEFLCPDRLVNTACCCDASSTFSCSQGRRRCCPNDGQWSCAIDFPPTLWSCSDGNLYERGEFADGCCCNQLEEPGRFGNDFCAEGVVCCPDGTWNCGLGDGMFSCGGDDALFLNELTQGEICLCDAPDECIEVSVCCDGLIFPTPCDAQAACYDTQDEEFCTFDFISLGNGFCSRQ